MANRPFSGILLVAVEISRVTIAETNRDVNTSYERSEEMANKLKLMCILAHPDDESLGNGGILAKYAAEGVETYLVTATRGERGWFGNESDYPGLEALGKRRETELLAAAQVLGIRRVDFLDYIDGDLDQAPPSEAVAKIVGHIRRVKPNVVVTFGPDGSYGHPDHIAICQLTTAAIVEAANPNSLYSKDLASHCVSKLYYMVASEQLLQAYQSVFGDMVMHIDGVERRGLNGRSRRALISGSISRQCGRQSCATSHNW
jgi:LmbE family N-acetylglucosaminyl deacetylase